MHDRIRTLYNVTYSVKKQVNLTKLLKKTKFRIRINKAENYRGNRGPIKNMYRTNGFALSAPIHVFGDFSTSASLSLGYH